jgi:hypothetical protein
MEANQFIVGNWYKAKNGTYGKFSRFTNGYKGEPDYYFHWSEWLDTNLNHEYYNGSWCRIDVEKEADMSVIACQLPYPVTINTQCYEIY